MEENAGKHKADSSGADTEAPSELLAVLAEAPELRRRDRMLGCVLGSAVGDARATRDAMGESQFGRATSLSILEALSFVEAGSVEAARPIAFDKFQQWSLELEKVHKTPIGSGHRSAIKDPLGFRGAAERYAARHPERGRGSDAITHSSFVAARWVGSSFEGPRLVANRFGSVTHANPAALEARMLLNWIVDGQSSQTPRAFDPLRLEVSISRAVSEYQPFVESVLTGEQRPSEWSNDEAWGCLFDAVHVLRCTDTFEECLEKAWHMEGDSRAVATVAGALAGATYGAKAMPPQWLDDLHGRVLGVIYGAQELRQLLERMLEVPLETWVGYKVAGELWRSHKAGDAMSTEDKLFVERFIAPYRNASLLQAYQAGKPMKPEDRAYLERLISPGVNTDET